MDNFDKKNTNKIIKRDGRTYRGVRVKIKRFKKLNKEIGENVNE